MATCLICGRNTTKPFADFVGHFRVIDWPQRHFIRGNFRTFGFSSGLRANVTLIFPFLNTIINWKHRKSSLEIEQPIAVSDGESNRRYLLERKMADTHECETPLDGLIQHQWTCKKCGTIWEVVGMDYRGNPEWETLGEVEPSPLPREEPTK